ncbi:hypothetical protein K474DRAFT_1573140, partial [Panus rudis PR-1116 ss-1]
HPQHKTHLLRLRGHWLVPVLLGDSTPRRDRGEHERELWARMMSILFVPWRTPRDLRQNPTESWTEMLDRRWLTVPLYLRTIIGNMNALSECRDARNEFSAARR